MATLKILHTLMALLMALTGIGAERQLRVGAARPEIYLPMVEGQRVALLGNHTSMVDDTTHTLDFLLANGVDVRVLFSPEHGFRGTADAGEHVSSGRDAKTGLPIASLYDGTRRGPAPEVMDSFDVVMVDLQDVGARFYTYHITMMEMMEAAARAGKRVIVLDRPNPLGMVVDGPVLEKGFESGVGRLPIPVVHGMTMGELARMINGEHWLKSGLEADLEVVPVEGYTHRTRYAPPVAPSPNLRCEQAILLYPSLCFFEGTPLSVGRGTDFPFMVYGYPAMKGHTFEFTPESRPGAKTPPLMGRKCRGADLRNVDQDSIIAAGINLDYIIDAYRSTGLGDKFFNKMFNLLAGNATLRRQISEGMTADEIRHTWQPGLRAFREQRKPYLLYAE